MLYVTLLSNVPILWMQISAILLMSFSFVKTMKRPWTAFSGPAAMLLGRGGSLQSSGAALRRQHEGSNTKALRLCTELWQNSRAPSDANTTAMAVLLVSMAIVQMPWEPRQVKCDRALARSCVCSYARKLLKTPHLYQERQATAPHVYL